MTATTRVKSPRRDATEGTARCPDVAGDTDSPATLWRLLTDGRDAVGEPSPSRAGLGTRVGETAQLRPRRACGTSRALTSSKTRRARPGDGAAEVNGGAADEHGQRLGQRRHRADQPRPWRDDADPGRRDLPTPPTASSEHADPTGPCGSPDTVVGFAVGGGCGGVGRAGGASGAHVIDSVTDLVARLVQFPPVGWRCGGTRAGDRERPRSASRLMPCSRRPGLRAHPSLLGLPRRCTDGVGRLLGACQRPAFRRALQHLFPPIPHLKGITN